MSSAVCRMAPNNCMSGLWHDGWHVAFATDSGDPIVERDKPPADATPVDEALLEHVGNRLNVAANGWIVGFGDGRPLLLPAQQKRGEGAVGPRFYGSRLFFGRHSGP
ncbi:MAG TPA: hypothetical protein VK730_11050 [Solirubrobacteraceae bacterium]|jgi:hypothetical protein|nr:hypothetical protein [Solirubrobacteraceae bacterium]